MSTHLNVLGWLYLFSSALLLIAAMFTGAVLGIVAAVAGDPGMTGLLGGLGAFLSFFLVLLGLPGLIEGYGLLRRRSWARPLGLVLGVLSLFNFPLGTALGVYTFWVLFQPESARLLGAAETRGAGMG